MFGFNVQGVGSRVIGGYALELCNLINATPREVRSDAPSPHASARTALRVHMTSCAFAQVGVPKPLNRRG